MSLAGHTYSRQLLGKYAAWCLLGSGGLGFLFAEIVLAKPAYVAFAEFTSRWWLALSLLICIIALAGVTGKASQRAIMAFRNRASVGRFIGLSAITFGLGLVEIVVAIAIFIAAILLSAPGAFQTIPIVHVR
jgi:hypothetical protein